MSPDTFKHARPAHWKADRMVRLLTKGYTVDRRPNPLAPTERLYYRRRGP